MVAAACGPATASAKTLVSFAQSGGIAGISDSVSVTTTGHVVVDGHRAKYDDSQARQVPRSVRAVVAELQRISRGGR